MIVCFEIGRVFNEGGRAGDGYEGVITGARQGKSAFIER